MNCKIKLFDPTLALNLMHFQLAQEHSAFLVLLVSQNLLK